jgi:hypothetical protein
VSWFPANRTDAGITVAAVAARRDVIAEYEAVAAAAGVHAGLVDLASLNVMNAVIGANAASASDWLLIHRAPEATALAIGRGENLMFYRHRPVVPDEPLIALVHQTVMYHEDRLGGTRFSRVWLAAAEGRGAGASGHPQEAGRSGRGRRHPAGRRPRRADRRLDRCAGRPGRARGRAVARQEGGLMLKGNLSARPFYNERLVNVGLAVAAAVALALAASTTAHSNEPRGQQSAVQEITDKEAANLARQRRARATQ